MIYRFYLCILAAMIAYNQSPPALGQVVADKPLGRLVMIGGGLGVNNKSVFLNLIEAAGGTQKARFAILPAASLSLESAHFFRAELAEFGVRSDQVTILEVLHSNAPQSANAPKNVAEIDRATAVYMTGGDQVRLVAALRNPDGSDTRLLAAMRRLYQRGGVIAGTSAGASAQSTQMLAASGLPSMLVDEGFDALDFGLTTDPVARGILVTRGLGFLEQGIIDQHFLQYRGRLGRLSRVTLEGNIPFGIGIDKNSAVRVDPNGKFSVISGMAIVVLPEKGVCRAGPVGCSIESVSIALLSAGDVFDPSTHTFTIHPSKQPIADGDLTFRGGFLITDIGSGYAISSALIGGLAENSQMRQEGIVLKFHDATSHGYHYHFRKLPTTQAFYADSLDGSLYSLTNIHLDIAPIANGLNASSTQRPVDLDSSHESARDAIAAVAFRGILPTNSRLEFRPNDAVTRREFAIACVRCVHLQAPAMNRAAVADLTERDEIELLQAIESGFVKLDDKNLLYPDRAIAAADLETGLRRLSQICASSPPRAFQLAMDERKNSDEDSVSRSDFAVLLAKLLFPQWLQQ